MSVILDHLQSVTGFFQTRSGIALLIVAAILLKFGPGLRVLWADVIENGANSVDREIVEKNFHLSTMSRPKEKPLSPETEKRLAEYRERVRLSDWDGIHKQLLQDDAARVTEDGGRRITHLGIELAMKEIHAAIGSGGNGAEERALEAVQDFEARLGDASDNLAAVVLAAHAHMEIGWLYRGHGSYETISHDALERMQYHFAQAQDILGVYKISEQRSPMLAAANFRLAVGVCNDGILFNAARAIWMDIDPGDVEMMEQVAFHLLPRWYGTPQQIVSAAAEIAEKTQEVMGDRAYAITLLSVAKEEPKIARTVDAPRLVQAAFDLMDDSENDQVVVNQVLAGLFYMALDCAGQRRKTLRNAVREILETRLKGLIMRFWSDPLADIRGNMANIFHRELEAGATIRIDMNGFRLRMPEQAAPAT